MRRWLQRVWQERFFPWLEIKATKGFDQDRSQLLAGIQGRVLEIGAGAGQNRPFFIEQGVKAVAIEPNFGMLKRLKTQNDIYTVASSAEHLPFADACFDAVVCFLVLCSVREPDQALSEIKRVLKPGGKLLFFEHVLADEAGTLKWQHRLTPMWSKFGGGCCLNRETQKLISGAGFLEEEVTRFKHPKIRTKLAKTIATGRVVKP